MQTPNPDTPPERIREPDSFWGALRRTARTTAGPVLLIWMATATAEFFVAAWFAADIASMRIGPWWDVPAHPEAWAVAPVAALVLPLLAAIRTAVFQPAREAYVGEDPGFGETVSQVLERSIPVLSTRIAIEVILLTVVIGCMVLRVHIPTFVLLPLAFSLAPALYLSATRELETGESLGKALRISHRRWLPIFAAHGAGLIAIALFGSQGGAGVKIAIDSIPLFPFDTLAKLQVLGAFLAGRYLDWLFVTTTYLYMDPD